MDASPPHVTATAAAPAVCAAWFGARPLEFSALPATGFSGVSLVRVRPRDTARWFVLKAFADGTPRNRAEWVHALVRHVESAGFAEVPPPLPTPAGETVVTAADGIHWELVPFVAGAAVASPSTSQVEAAIAALARLHVAAAAWSGAPPRLGPSPGVERRVSQCRDLITVPWTLRRARASAAGEQDFSSAVGERWDRAIAVFGAAGGMRAVAAVAATRGEGVRLQAVLRDVWSAHVLFASDGHPRVAGIVDLHAAGIDVVAADIARLLGSWRRGGPAHARSGDPMATWPEAVAAYAAVRPLSRVERGLVPFLHAAGVVCGLDNWFRWTLEEHRRFVAPAATLARIDELLAVLPAALEWLAECGPFRV